MWTCLQGLMKIQQWLEDIKETKRYGRTDRRKDAHTDNVKTVYPPQTKFAGGIISELIFGGWGKQRFDERGMWKKT